MFIRGGEDSSWRLLANSQNSHASVGIGRTQSEVGVPLSMEQERTLTI
jgi:hypothetical protein